MEALGTAADIIARKKMIQAEINQHFRIKYLKLLHNLSEAFGESDDQTPEEIRQELREEGFDIDSAEKRLLEFQRELSVKIKETEAK